MTQCDSAWSAYDEPWLNYTIPMKGSSYDQCTRYVTNGNSARITTNYYANPASKFCAPEYFNQSVTEKCENDFKFRDTEYTISNEVTTLDKAFYRFFFLQFLVISVFHFLFEYMDADHGWYGK